MIKSLRHGAAMWFAVLAFVAVAETFHNAFTDTPQLAPDVIADGHGENFIHTGGDDSDPLTGA